MVRKVVSKLREFGTGKPHIDAKLVSTLVQIRTMRMYSETSLNRARRMTTPESDYIPYAILLKFARKLPIRTGL